MRKTVNYPVADEGRDKGKLFVITEMTASKGEDWAMRVILALLNSNVEVPEDFAVLGMSALASMGLKCLGQLKIDVARPLLLDMMECVTIIPDTRNMMVVRKLVEEDIEEVTTRLKLKAEVFKLHTDFLQAASPSAFLDKMKGALRQFTETSPSS